MSISNSIANDKFIVVNKNLAHELGLEEAILIGELATEHNYWKQQGKLDDGYFYATLGNVRENTTLSPHKQRQALNHLQSLNIVDVKSKGFPARRYIKINFEELDVKKLNTDVKKLNTNNNINNNINNNNKQEKEKYGASRTCMSDYDLVINANIADNAVKDALHEFIKMRKTIKKPPTVRALELIIKRLQHMAPDSETQLKILEQSIMNNWKGIYPLENADKCDYRGKNSNTNTNDKDDDELPDWFASL